MTRMLPNMLKAASPSKAPDRSGWRGLPATCVDQAHQLATAICNRDFDAAIWSRTLPLAFENWLGAIAPAQWPQGRFVLHAHDIAACLVEQFAAARIAPSPALTWFAEDVMRLGKYVRELVDAPLVRLRLEPVFDDACSKLHIDNVVARLICTYAGPGTELGLDAIAPESAEQIATGAPVLLKGKLWAGPVQPVLRHRSPSIAGSGEARLVVVLEGCTPAEIYPQYDMVYPDSEIRP